MAVDTLRTLSMSNDWCNALSLITPYEICVAIEVSVFNRNLFARIDNKPDSCIRWPSSCITRDETVVTTRTGTTMEKMIKEPGLTTEGIVFSVEVDSVEREFLILKSALDYLCKLQGFTMDFMNTYRACEARIHSVARRLAAGAPRGAPLVLNTACFI
jgi:hypothetical protein